MVVLKIKFGDDLRRISIERNPSYDELQQITRQLFNLTSGVSLVLKYEDEEHDLVTITSQHELQDALDVGAQHFGNVLRLTVCEKQASSIDMTSSALLLSSSPSTITTTTPTLIPNITSHNINNNNNNNNMLTSNMNMLTSNMNLLGSFISQLSSSSAAEVMSKLGGMSLTQQQLQSNGIPAAAVPPAATSSPATVPAPATSPSSSDNALMHYGVSCDECHVNPIQGIRYKCSICNDYDLCERCKALGGSVHDVTHPMTKIVTPVNYFNWQQQSMCQQGQAQAQAQAQGQAHTQQQVVSPANAEPQPQESPRTSAKKSNRRLQAKFVKDVTVVDGTLVLPGHRFTKVWRVRNESALDWPHPTHIINVGGDPLGVASSCVVPGPVGPGQEVDISVDMTAPKVAGRYNSFWRLVAPDGQRFGQRMWADITVSPDAVAVPSDVPAPAAPVVASPVPVPVPAPVAPPASVASPTLSLSPTPTPSHPHEITFAEAMKSQQNAVDSYVHQAKEQIRIAEEEEAKKAEAHAQYDRFMKEIQEHALEEAKAKSQAEAKAKAEAEDQAKAQAQQAQAQASVTPNEAQTLTQLNEMGFPFSENLLSLLRKHQGSVAAILGELLG